MRGPLTRAAFAERVGVSELTVYRWEQPRDGPRSRQPRGASLQRLAACADGLPLIKASHPPSGSTAARTRPGPAMGPLPRAVQHILNARFASAENALIDALGSGALDHSSGRALAHVCTGLLALFARNDARAAMSSASAFLAEVGAAGDDDAVDAVVLGRGYALAALVFGTPDGRLYAPTRVATLAQLARAAAPDDDTDSRALAAIAECWCAFHQGHRADFQSVLQRRGADLAAASTPVPRLLREHLEALSSALDGFQPDACRRLSALAEDAFEIGFQVGATRALARLAMASHITGAPRQSLIAIADRFAVAQQQGRLQPGFSDLLVGAVRAEALHGLGRFADAAVVVADVEALSQRLDWPAADLLMVQTRLTFQTEGTAGVTQLVQRFEGRFGGLGRPSIDACVRYLQGLDAQMRGDGLASAQRFAEAHALAVSTGVRPWLEHFAVCLELASCAYFGGGQDVAATERRFARSLERTPSPWFSALRDHMTGMVRAGQGREVEARQCFEACIATMVLCGEVTEAARARRSLAMAATVLGAADADRLFDQSDAEMVALGIPTTDAQSRARAQALGRDRRAATLTGSSSSSLSSSSMVVHVQRLAVRGLLPSQLLEALAAIATTTAKQPAAVVEYVGEATVPVVNAAAVSAWADPDWMEFGDGCGRRYGLGWAVRPTGEVRAALTVLAAAAALALEVNALRAVADPKSSSQLSSASEVPGFVVASDAMRAVVADVQRLGRSRATVLLYGESGSGKEQIARAVHDWSSRHDGPYITFNCTAVPRDLFEGQLFGYRKGAFTGADRNHPGVIRAADGGTLFLDEVGELPLDVQAKLLRFLENREVQPLGETRPVTVDVRVVAATHRDLNQMVRDGAFREDLLFRLQVVPLHLPPLRARRDDILPLAQHFLRAFTLDSEPVPRLSPEAVMALMAHPWPGNVRELRNVIERSLAFSPAPAVLGPEHLRLTS